MTSLDKEQLEPEETQPAVPAIRRLPRTRGDLQAAQHGFNQQVEDLIVLLNYEDLKKTLLLHEINKEAPTVPAHLMEDPTDPANHNLEGNPRKTTTAPGNSTSTLAAQREPIPTEDEAYHTLETNDPSRSLPGHNLPMKTHENILPHLPTTTPYPLQPIHALKTTFLSYHSMKDAFKTTQSSPSLMIFLDKATLFASPSHRLFPYSSHHHNSTESLHHLITTNKA